MTEYGEYGETLARYRDEAGLNQRQLGAAIGLDSTQLNKVERGRRPPLGAKYVQPLVRALRLSRSEAEKLFVDLGGLSPKVLDFMDSRQMLPPASKASSRAGTAAFGAGGGLSAILTPPTLGSLIDQIGDETPITPDTRKIAERLILEHARTVYAVLSKEHEDERT